MAAADDPPDAAKVMHLRDLSFRAVLQELRTYITEFEPLWDQAIKRIDTDQVAALDTLIELEIRLRHFGMVAIENLLEDVDSVTDALDKVLPGEEARFEDVDRLLSGDAEDRAWAAQQLVRFDSDGTRSRLRALLDDPDEDVRGSAAQTLAILGDRNATPALLRLLANDDGARVNAVRWAATKLAEGHPSDWNAVVNDLLRIKANAVEVQHQIDLLLGPDKRRSRKAPRRRA